MKENEINQWLEVASHDIDTARLLIREKGHADIIIYHLHQAVEKLLKAVLTGCDLSFEKIHRLDKLLNIAITCYPDLISIKDEVLEIDYYLPKLRYPAGEKITLDTAVRVYEQFQKIEPILNEYARGLF